MSSRQITTRTIFIIWPCMQYGIFVFLLIFYRSIFGINLPKGCALQCFRFGLAEKQTPRSTLLKKSWNQMTCFEISENINRQNTHIWKNTMHRGANYLTREEKKSHASRPKHSVMLDRHMKNKVCFRLKKTAFENVRTKRLFQWSPLKFPLTVFKDTLCVLHIYLATKKSILVSSIKIYVHIKGVYNTTIHKIHKTEIRINKITTKENTVRITTHPSSHTLSFMQY